jgi:hypothetical protein
VRRFLIAPALLAILGAAALAGAYSSGLLSTSGQEDWGEPHGNLSLDVSGMTDTGTSDNAYNAVGPIGTVASVTDTCGDENDMIIVELVIGDSGTQDGVDESGGIPRGTAEAGTQCDNGVDDDADGLINDGCPAYQLAESKTQCLDDLDNEALPDGRVNDGCPQSDGLDIGGWQARIQFDPDVLTFIGHQISDSAAGAQYYMEKASVHTAVTNDHLSVVDPAAAPGIGTFDIGSTILGVPPGANGVGLLARLYFDCAPAAAEGGGTCIDIADSTNSFYAGIFAPRENHNYVARNSVSLGVNGGPPPASCPVATPTPTPTPTPAPTPTPPPPATVFAPHASFSLADSTLGANSDYTVEFNIDAPQYMFGAVIAFTPEEFSTGREAEVPIGALMARLTSAATLGLVNVACFSPVTPVFDMMNATTDITNVLPDAYGALEGRNPGSADDQFDIVDGLPLGVTMYPDYLNRILVDSNGNPLQPRARLYGQTVVAGTDVSLNFAQFEPGTNIGDTQLDPALGFPLVTVLQDIADPEAVMSPNVITDFCSPLTASATFFAVSKDNPDTAADEGGVDLSANPAGDQTFNFVLFAASMPDADNDGIENFLDTCPLDGNPDGWDPRDIATPGDFDGDGLPDSCDPTPNVTWESDLDFYANRGDNCPTVANGISPGPDGMMGTEDDVVIGPNNQADRDTDQIGDACDPNPDTRDGDIVTVCRCTAVDVGAGGSAPPCPNLCSEDKVGIDLDGDGIFDSLQPTPTPTPTPAPTPTPSPEEFHAHYACRHKTTGDLRDTRVDAGEAQVTCPPGWEVIQILVKH